VHPSAPRKAEVERRAWCRARIGWGRVGARVRARARVRAWVRVRVGVRVRVRGGSHSSLATLEKTDRWYVKRPATK